MIYVLLLLSYCIILARFESVNNLVTNPFLLELNAYASPFLLRSIAFAVPFLLGSNYFKNNLKSTY